VKGENTICRKRERDPSFFTFVSGNREGGRGKERGGTLSFFIRASSFQPLESNIQEGKGGEKGFFFYQSLSHRVKRRGGRGRTAISFSSKYGVESGIKERGKGGTNFNLS